MNPTALWLSAALFSLSGCAGRGWVDAWKPIPAPQGKAWHNAACQQTVFDTNGDGRVDRLRFWIGSGLAEEFIDEDRDGWFDTHLKLAYEKGERRRIRSKAPAVPITDAAGSYARPGIEGDPGAPQQPLPGAAPFQLKP